MKAKKGTFLQSIKYCAFGIPVLRLTHSKLRQKVRALDAVRMKTGRTIAN